MPSSCDSDQNSPSLIPSLRNYRFQNKRKGYQYTQKANSDSQSETSDTQKAGSSQGSASGSESVDSKCSTSSTSNFKQSDEIFIQRVTLKLKEVISNQVEATSSYSVKLTFAEIKRFRNALSIQNPRISLKWAEHVAEDSTNSTDTEKVLKFNRPFLKELLLSFEDLSTVAPGCFVPVNSNLTSSVKTYGKRTISESDEVSSVVKTEVSEDNSGIRSDGQKQLAMDDYEVFCEKETSLRKLLNDFPDADIMEAQDILVTCKWDLNKAMDIARRRPPRNIRKRPANNQEEEDNLDKAAEEIVLDSSDEEQRGGTSRSSRHQSNNANSKGSNAPLAKKARPLLSSSGSEDEAASVKRSKAVAQTEAKKSAAGKLQNQTNSGSGSSAQTLQNQASTVKVSTTQQNTNAKPSQSTVNKSVPVTATPKPNVNSKLVQASVTKPVTATSAPKPVQASVTKPVTTTSAAKPVQASVTKTVPVTSAPKPVQANVTKTVPVTSTPKTVQSNVPVPVTTSTPKPSIVSKPVQPVDKSASTSKQNPNIKPQQVAEVSKQPTNAVAKTSNDKAITQQNTDQIPKSQNTSPMSINSMPNLPKGLVITEIQPSSNSQAQPISAETQSQLNALASLGGISITPTIVPNSDVITHKIGSGISITPTNSNSNASSVSETNTVENHNTLPSKTAEKQRRYEYEEEEDEEYDNEDIYDSEDSDCEENITAAHSNVLNFFQDGTSEELSSIPGCSKKKVEAIINLRPFKSWGALVDKLKNDKSLSPELLNGAKKVMDMRNAITKLMTKCQQISLDMEDLVEDLKGNRESSSDYVNKQPDLLNDKMHLTGYQMLGLNWLLLMHNQEVNGILADEMGLGKTVQAIAFLAYLKQISISGPHLIVVPSSTLDNWKKELVTWWPDVTVLCYHGSQDSRRELRLQILNDEVDEFDVMVTTYNMITSSVEDRNFFKRLEFHYVVFDEAHMLKNMASQRYQHLMRIKAPRRLLLTGTPLQNNLVELMSLLIFAMPHMFSGKTEQIKQMFSCVCKNDDGKGTYEKEKIEHAKRIMKPFVLRRLKTEVLKELPTKHEEIKFCPLSADQAKKYEDLVSALSKEVESNKEKDITSSGAGMMMQLRRAANHPLLLRQHYNDDKLLKLSKLILKEPTHAQADSKLVFEDMAVMHDFELHKLCKTYKTLKSHALPDEVILNSGKFEVLDSLLPKMFEEEHRILLFSQFTMVLDIVQEYMDIKGYEYLRLDGQVPVTERQDLIDEFNGNPDINVFLLSTRAGGLGINLTAADTVILHDIDFNPYNDKQAEDRCHRVGQMREVRVIRLISEDTIEEGILQRAKEKLKLEKDIHEDDTEEKDVASVAKLLRDALGLKTTKR